ncbi:NAD-glutamate dehydrogenase domain-containing protein [Magnetococcales bacterium HHB-1]
MNKKNTASELTIHDLTTRLMDNLSNSVSHVVPWFAKVMPEAYFKETDQETQFSHLKALVAAQASETPISMTLHNLERSIWTYIGEEDRPGLLTELLARLPQDKHLRSAKVYSAKDASLVIDIFYFTVPSRFDSGDAIQNQCAQKLINYVLQQQQGDQKTLNHYIQQCAADYILTISKNRFLKHWQLYTQVQDSNKVVVDISPLESSQPGLHIALAAGRAHHRQLFERMVNYLSMMGMDIRNTYLDIPKDAQEGSITLLTVKALITAKRENLPSFAQMTHDLQRLKWLDQRALDLSYQQTEVSLQQAEIIIALCDLAHQKLSRLNPFTYARNRILSLVKRFIPFAITLADLLAARFAADSPLTETDFQKQLRRLKKQLPSAAEGEDIHQVLETLIEAVDAVLRCNINREERFALAMRLNPAFMDAPEKDRPFGIFFIHGRAFNGFHVRFRDIARGGVRIVRTSNNEHHTLESERLFDEVHGLASAQQLKNKDIPEGGSKAVILLEPGSPVVRSVKAFGDAILDLLIPHSPSLKPEVDRLQKQEWLYLGPDENMTDDLIVWLVAQAKKRGYPMADAFMSSKPETGVNHKMYGVTSEGVNVFLEIALQTAGIDPRKQPFTIKMTGGPDGDVAGNEIRILHREYGENARIIGIADGSGAAEDPQGLDFTELLRLVDLSEPIAAFNPEKLSSQGKLFLVDQDDGVQKRNTLHNRLVADAFLPCGGRPGTIHEGNWQKFLTEGGESSAKVIVEGANLFITKKARLLLGEASNVLIVKDSSANKAGVICSSYEISASMLLSNERFQEIKETFVMEVLDRLRRLARQEAQLLFREYRYRPGRSLPELSEQISLVINQAAAAIEQSLENLRHDHQDLLLMIVKDHLPPTLVDEIGDQGITHLPLAYLNSTMASTLAARIIYQEGLDFLSEMSPESLAKLAINYLKQEQKTQQLIRSLKAIDLPEREEIITLLKKGGTRAGLLN